MTDHTRTEKIGGDSINFYDHPSRAGNRYDSLATPLGTSRVKPINQGSFLKIMGKMVLIDI